MPDTGARVPVLEARQITKSYGHVEALRGVDLQVFACEVVALVGDNGAGKSTLMNVLCGAHRQSGGELFFDGDAVQLRSPKDSAALGISVVYQDLALVEERDVATNVFLGSEPTRRLVVDRKRMRADAREVLASLNINIGSVRTPVRMLSGGQRQSVAIARAVRQGGRVVLMDEPTAALGVAEQGKVLKLISDLRARGTSVVLVSHNLEHVMLVADRVVVLRGGRTVGKRLVRDTTITEVVEMIVGGHVSLETHAAASSSASRDTFRTSLAVTTSEHP